MVGIRGWFKGLHGWRRVLAWIVVVVVVAGAGIVAYREIDEHQMREVVHSDEANKVFEKIIHFEDSKAFTPQGVIRSYTIDDDTISHNPMGGIMVTLVINNNRDLTIDTTLNRFIKGDKYGPLKPGASIVSSKLDDLVTKNE